MQGLIDSTLREGGQMVGVDFRLPEKMAIICALDRIGIEEIEVGVASRLDHDLPQLLCQCRNEKIRARLALWSRCRLDDIDYAGTLGPDVLSLSVPGSDLHIEKKLRRDRTWVLTCVTEGVAHARAQGINFISLGIEDATRSDPAFLEKIIDTAQRAGVDRIRLADTVGIATPLEMRRIIRHLGVVFKIPFGVHCHNDFGMATANSVTALESGASWVDVTVCGIGERAGNARLEEVTAYLALKQKRDYELHHLKDLAGIVARCRGKEVDPHHPVIGEKIFQCETGLHLQGLQADTSTYEPYPPEVVGRTRELLYGAKIGLCQWRRLTARLSIDHPPPSSTDSLITFRRFMSQQQHPLEEQDVRELFSRGEMPLPPHDFGRFCQKHKSDGPENKRE